jgi:hypothetical protein
LWFNVECSERLRRLSEVTLHGPFMEEFGFGGKDTHMFLMEFPRVLEHVLRQTLEDKKPHKPRGPSRLKADQP